MVAKIKARSIATKVKFTSKGKPHFQRAIEAAEALTLGQRETLVDVLKKRNSEARRREIEREIGESLKEYEQGKAKSGSLEDLLKDLDT